LTTLQRFPLPFLLEPNRHPTRHPAISPSRTISCNSVGWKFNSDSLGRLVVPVRGHGMCIRVVTDPGVHNFYRGVWQHHCEWWTLTRPLYLQDCADHCGTWCCKIEITVRPADKIPRLISCTIQHVKRWVRRTQLVGRPHRDVIRQWCEQVAVKPCQTEYVRLGCLENRGTVVTPHSDCAISGSRVQLAIRAPHHRHDTLGVSFQRLKVCSIIARPHPNRGVI
jgi:hypothetical protein